MSGFYNDGRGYSLKSPTQLPNASAFLWNPRMMIQMTCRGYAVSQFMQPEPAKYTHPPSLAATTFMQPEHPYFAHHPGRFFYLKDDETGALFSAPYEPVRAAYDNYEFRVETDALHWSLTSGGVLVELTLRLASERVAELWEVKVSNVSEKTRQLSLVPYFPVGYASWMNQGAHYHPDLGGVVVRCVTPYQKVTDYPKHRHFKDLTVLLSDRTPTAWEASQPAFEGEGGLHAPSALEQDTLGNGDAIYEIPACILQHKLELAPGESATTRFLFGPALDLTEVRTLKQELLNEAAFQREAEATRAYLKRGAGCVQLRSPDDTLNHYVNTWAPRQVYYHGAVNRLTTDPQTRNYLQDAMGMSFIQPERTREAFLRALSQQEASGGMPDGILLSQEAELKYINQVPHTDHAIWLPVCLEAYLQETGDHGILEEQLPFDNAKGEGSQETASVFEHINRAMQWLINARDERGLSLIAQGDWCDPMNMVGYKGKGVSGWLTQAVSVALSTWHRIALSVGRGQETEAFVFAAGEINALINEHFWDGKWYARGITDDNVHFGTQKDKEGTVFLNPQTWALLAGAPDDEQEASLLSAVKQHLEGPYGVELLGPAFTAMRDDVGRVTQKWPGTAENGSVYNHAAAFFAFALFTRGRTEHGLSVLRRMIAGPDEQDLLQRGQLPVFVPNYYRGALRQFPRTAGRSSQLFNTGTISWFYRIIAEQLVGIHGDGEGIRIQPQLPSSWPAFAATRTLRGVRFEVEVVAGAEASLRVNGEELPEGLLTDVTPGAVYKVLATVVPS